MTYLVQHQDYLYAFIIFTTIVEGIIGLFLIAGFATRISGLGSALLVFGILLGSGWIGSTCLDEWQIGVILISTGIANAISGAGPLSIYNWLMRTKPKMTESIFFRIFFSGSLPIINGKRIM